MKSKSVLSVLLVAVAGSAAYADGDGDIAIGNWGGVIVTGIGSDAPGAPPPVFPERVFGAELIDFDGLGTIAIDEPGFLGPFGDGFDVGQQLFMANVAAARVWDGSTFVATDHTIESSYLSATVSTADTTPLLIVNDASQDFDDHAINVLLGAGGTAPSAGIYLQEIEISGPGLTTSETVFIVYNYGFDDAIHDAAIEYVEDVLVPAPGSLALLGMTGLIATRRRR
ncbi:MAG: hypothetical protein ACF8SC_12520 [Phycisphaerales bacterium JB037]